ncbi:virulence factor Mce family protein [Mycolicibacterium chubuense NBB4]|uniref:Virulence factor Mce family protein n=1 Tax=Mycolicibacterium chubuense (strain NBB4) TaxID=710421 RepID=I4BHF1_MYCCN|nr:MlaD family protein [Mycolicibacterium chubuense]AFM16708.1 virulence factor Mce family protein [Mycolicibacterium chubuense NBB4]
MFTRLVRIQLVLFTVASVVGISVMVVNYLKAPTMLGLGRITVTMRLPDAGGLYRFANVTYRGVQLGKVTAVDVNARGAVATLSLATSPQVPADLRAAVRSVSAVGEQYVDLQPRTESGPYLHDGSVIPESDTVIPQPVAPMMEKLSALVTSIPKDRLGQLLDESFTAFNGAGPDLQSLSDSIARIATDADATAGRTAQLVDDAQPVLDGQVVGADALRTWSQRLAGVSRQLVADDPHVRTLLDTGPAAAQEVSRLLGQVEPTLPVMLANMTSLGQVAVTYHPGLEQLLVLLPPSAAMYQSATPSNNPTGLPLGDFRISIDDPPACTVGFLPPSQWRSPADTSTIDTPDGLYCKLPQDSAIAVRGARNFPCMDKPGKYAPTVEICKSDKPFQPLAAREHATGPYTFDPNLVSQGVPPDSRVGENDTIYGPAQGTPRPPLTPAPTAPPAPPAAPSVAVAHYDPVTGLVAAPDGTVFAQTDLGASGHPHSWQDLVLPPTEGARR